MHTYIHTYVHTWVTCVCLLMLYLRMNFRFACSDALIGTKSGIFTKLMDASLEVHVLLRRKHRIWFIRPQIYWHASHPIYTNRNIQVHWGHGVERFGVWGRTLFTSLHIFQGFCVSTGIFVSLYLCVKEIIRAYNSSNWWQAPRHVHMITYWWVACSDRTWCHPWRGSDGCPRLWEMTLPPPKKLHQGTSIIIFARWYIDITAIK